MTRGRSGHRRRSPLFWGYPVVTLALMVAGTVLFVGKKVELDSIARRLEAVEGRIEVLQDQRSRLTETIVFKQKPGAIEQIARGRLDMSYSSQRLSDLSRHADREGIPE